MRIHITRTPPVQSSHQHSNQDGTPTAAPSGQDGKSLPDTTFDIPLVQIGTFIAAVTAVITAVPPLITSIGALFGKKEPTPIVLTQNDMKMYQNILSIDKESERRKTLLFFVKHHLLPGDENTFKDEGTEIPHWPVTPKGGDSGDSEDGAGKDSPAAPGKNNTIRNQSS